METSLPGVCLLEPVSHADARGWLFESYNQRELMRLGINDRFVHDNHSKSLNRTLRGLHYQLRHPQAKLCRVVVGELIDVVVDIRTGSPTFGSWTSIVLSAANRLEIYIPSGFAHGVLALSASAQLLYKCSDFYYPEDNHGIVWNDPDLAISWPERSPLLSERDQRLPRLRQIPAQELPSYQQPK